MSEAVQAGAGNEHDAAALIERVVGGTVTMLGGTDAGEVLLSVRGPDGTPIDLVIGHEGGEIVVYETSYINEEGPEEGQEQST